MADLPLVCNGREPRLAETRASEHPCA